PLPCLPLRRVQYIHMHAPLVLLLTSFLFFFFHDTATTEIYTLSLHDALPICGNDELKQGSKVIVRESQCAVFLKGGQLADVLPRSEEHTSELQSRFDLVCRLLLEKKKKQLYNTFELSVRPFIILRCMFMITLT